MKVAVVIDMQNDFMPGGALPVPRGREIIPNILEALKDFDHVVFTKDFHPKNHISFASSHENKRPFDQVIICGRTFKLWPDHCIAGTPGANVVSEFDSFNDSDDATYVVKGTGWYNEGYSASSGLTLPFKQLAQAEALSLQVTIMGVATEYCVLQTVLDILENEHIEYLYVKRSCIAPVDEEAGEAALARMEATGAIVIP